MLSVAVHKDVGEYQPKLVGKLTFRTIGCIAAALGVSLAAGLYGYFVLGLESDEFQMAVMLLSLPFWAMGFWRPKGLKAEVFVRYWLEYNFTRKQVFYKPSFKLVEEGDLNADTGKKERKVNVYDDEYRKLTRMAGIESYSPKSGRVLV